MERIYKLILAILNMIKRWNNSGQFYLAAAIVIIIIIVGFAGVSNYLQRGEPVRIYDLKDELGIESGQVLDHGVYKEYNTDETNELLKSFTQNYSHYVEKGFSLYFVFGNAEKLVIAGYKDLITGKVSVEHGGSTSFLQITQGVYNSTTLTNPVLTENHKVNVLIEGNTYEFELKTGDNFYFVIYQKTEGGTFVEKG